MTVSATLYQWEKKRKTRHKETPTTRQSLLLYTTPLFTLHSKSLHVPPNQLTATEALYAVCKTKTNNNKKKTRFLQVSSPFHIQRGDEAR